MRKSLMFLAVAMMFSVTLIFQRCEKKRKDELFAQDLCRISRFFILLSNFKREIKCVKV